METLRVFKEGMISMRRQRFRRKELPVDMEGNLPYRMRNAERSFTKEFMCSEIDVFYIGLNPEGFSNFVCAWFGSVPDCYILHSRNPNGHFKQFSDIDNLNFDHDND